MSITNSRSWFKPMSIESLMPSNHFNFHHSLLLLSVFSSIWVFSNESVLHIRWQKYWNFSFNISPSNEYSGLISFRMDWLDLLAVQGILNSLLQHHSSNVGWINTTWCIHKMEYYSSIKRREVLIHAITWMNLENTLLSERSP